MIEQHRARQVEAEVYPEDYKRNVAGHVSAIRELIDDVEASILSNSLQAAIGDLKQTKRFIDSLISNLEAHE